ncbi:MAG: twin-arginine translocase TatA/TatE family subunit, partial [Coriobacteriales bacterium]|nr:twin-arginine translocase TatA/TatE family subunit [Coriobacteriales bacterium]
MFGIGETELVIIVVFAFLLFGPDKLPGMGRTLGRVLRQFREASDGFTEVVQTNIMDPASEELEKSPKQRSRDASQDTFEEDADVQTDDEAQEAPKRETFAQRRERLKAEREATERAAAAASAEEPAEQEAVD